jgi:LAS superfamily LD-carboxypeptidase LdcB
VKDGFIRHLKISQPHFHAQGIFITLVCVAVFGSFLQGYIIIGNTLQNTRTSLAVTTQALALASTTLSSTQKENSALLGQLTDEQLQNAFYGQQIDSISSTVGQLYKLSQTDKELLQKYSNVYFLNENYVPSQLSLIDSQYLYNKNTPIQIHTNVKPYLESLLNATASSSIPLSVLSGYRSFGTQSALKASYKVTYGTTSANSFSADQGYSEHQLGSAVDFTTPTTGDALTGFEKTPAYTWLLDNAYKYGFILSYPQGNKYYIFEPWHWRFVGVALATQLHNTHMNFYDMDQRTIDTYLVNIFD